MKDWIVLHVFLMAHSPQLIYTDVLQQQAEARSTLENEKAELLQFESQQRKELRDK